MKLVTEIINPSEWYDYQFKLLGGFRKADISYKKLNDVFKLMSNISGLMTDIMNAEVNYRRDHKKIHKEKIIKYYQQANEILDVLNENFILEILMGE